MKRQLMSAKQQQFFKIICHSKVIINLKKRDESVNEDLYLVPLGARQQWYRCTKTSETVMIIHKTSTIQGFRFNKTP